MSTARKQYSFCWRKIFGGKIFLKFLWPHSSRKVFHCLYFNVLKGFSYKLVVKTKKYMYPLGFERRPFDRRVSFSWRRALAQKSEKRYILFCWRFSYKLTLRVFQISMAEDRTPQVQRCLYKTVFFGGLLRLVFVIFFPFLVSCSLLGLHGHSIRRHLKISLVFLVSGSCCRQALNNLIQKQRKV